MSLPADIRRCLRGCLLPSGTRRRSAQPGRARYRAPVRALPTSAAAAWQYRAVSGRWQSHMGEPPPHAPTPGDEDAEIQETGQGQSEGDDSDHQTDEDNDKTGERDLTKKAGQTFGKEHVNVVYDEERIEVVDEQENRQKLIVWREQQKPHVRSFEEEMKKRMALKEDSRRDGLMSGRLSSKLTTLVLDERPKLFYRKNAPSTNLDAVFGLLVDGSASMIDKLAKRGTIHKNKAANLKSKLARRVNVQAK